MALAGLFARAANAERSLGVAECISDMTKWKPFFTLWARERSGPARMHRRSNAGGIFSTGRQVTPVNEPPRPGPSDRVRPPRSRPMPASAGLGAVVLSLVLLEACSDDTPTKPEGADPVTSGAMGINADGMQVVIEPHWLTLDTIGVTGTLSATVIDAEGDTVDAPQVTWASADAAIATVDSAGVVTSVALGRTKVTATYDSATAEAAVEVAPRLTDREILEILYEATGGDGWKDNTNWLSDADLSEWYGVATYRGRVEYLSLRNNNLVGTIPPELGGLEELFILFLSSNRLSGPIPAELSKFKRLRDLYLSWNEGISGRVPPELGFTGGLQYLALDQTSLSGPLPLTFRNLALTRLAFDHDGPCVPAGLEEWVKSLPEPVYDYRLCTDQIEIAPDSLHFEAPPLGDTMRLSAALIDAAGDTVPGATITWTSADRNVATVDSAGLVTSVDYGATRVTARHDSLTASVDVRVAFTLSDREVLDTLHRVMGGGNWSDTTNWLSDEALSEWYGVETDEAGKVVGLSLGANNLTGTIPAAIGELGDLVALDLSRNGLAGRIPPRLTALRRLRDLLLNDNALEDELPWDMGFMTELRHLNIGGNDFVGVVPPTFSGLQLDTLLAAGSGVCVPPSLNNWLAAIEHTDEVDRCTATLAIEIVDLPSPTFYAVGETGVLSATYVDAEGDSTYGAPVTWSSGDASVASVDVSGRVTAVGTGSTEVTASRDSTTASIEVVVDPPENDRDVLEILYDRARGDGWTDGTHWTSEEPLSEWAGVETDDSGRVAGLSLRDNNLRGSLHSSIGLLDRLVTLDLGGNWLFGSIPAEVGNLSLLRELVLRVNGLVGELPAELGALDSLRILNVSVTGVSGLVPASFAGLDLESFLVNGTHVCIPPSLSGWLDSIPHSDDPSECAGSVTVAPSPVTFGAIGDTVLLAAAVVGPEGVVVEAPEVTWTSGDPGVARVDATGLVTARHIGVTTVTATYDSVTAGTVEVAVRPPGSDRVALEALYRAAGGDDWTDNTNWLSDEPLGEWYGIEAYDNGRVRYLELRENNLTGRIPAEVGLLDSLFSFNLSYNDLAGPIPPSIGRLTRVRDLNLRDNMRLDGPLPAEMGDMAGLQYADLSNTDLTGPLPETFADLTVPRFYHQGTNLCVPRSLAAWYERLGNRDPLPCIPRTADRDALVTIYKRTGGPEWNNRRNWLSERSLNTWHGILTDPEGYVTEIFMPWNNMTDSLPPEVGDLGRLEVLALWGNELTGRIPPELGKLTRVRELSLSGNKLEGPIPPEIGGMVGVSDMWLSWNNLSGPIPAEFGNLVNLERLAIFENELSGPLPAEMGKLTKLKTLWAVENKFGGPLPPEMGDMTALEDISLGGNRITGPIPPELGRLQNLRYLGIPDNRLTGPIPAELGNLASLTELFLMRNRLSDSIPPELGKLSNLTWMWIFDNRLTGPIPRNSAGFPSS